MVVILWRALSRFYSGPDHKKFFMNAIRHVDLDPFAFLALVALRPGGLDLGQLFSYRLSCVRLSALDIVWNIP